MSLGAKLGGRAERRWESAGRKIIQPVKISPVWDGQRGPTGRAAYRKGSAEQARDPEGNQEASRLLCPALSCAGSLLLRGPSKSLAPKT